MQLLKIKSDSIGGVSAEKMAKTLGQSYVGHPVCSSSVVLSARTRFLIRTRFVAKCDA